MPIWKNQFSGFGIPINFDLLVPKMGFLSLFGAPKAPKCSCQVRGPAPCTNRLSNKGFGKNRVTTRVKNLLRVNN